jgi:hypothetical protein
VENSALSAHFGKYPGLVGKLALILHVADDPGGTRVSGKTITKALYVAPYSSVRNIGDIRMLEE